MTLYPKKIANDITNFLDAFYANDISNRFPVDIINLAKEWSKKECPDDPILNIIPADINCEGLLDNTDGWNIFYSNKQNLGRQRFTIAHEFGHYLLHKNDLLHGIECDYSAMNDWGSDEKNRENQANTFASWVLMPLNDYRKRLENNPKNLETFTTLSHFYGTSLTSTILKFLEMTEDRAVLIFIKDGFVLWSRSSEKALKTNKFIKASKIAIETPKDSLANSSTKELKGIHKNHGGWFNNVAYTEMNLPYGDSYNLTLLIMSPTDYPEESDDDFVKIIYSKRPIL
jgi:Zn-dependent peptidase ImmA (M78 family)